MIDSLYNLLSRFGITSHQDKVLHFVVGLGLGVIGQLLFPESILMLIPVLVGAIGKELYDELVRDTYFDFFDMIATIAGGFAGIVTYGLLAWEITYF